MVGIAAVALVLAACGDDAGGGAAGGGPTVAVTTSILGDVVADLVGDQAEVVVLMPAGADPHTFQPSARDADRARRADAVVVNGGGFEEGLLDLVGSIAEDGIPVHEVVTAGEDDDHAGEDDHAEEDEHAGEDEDHEHAADAHFFTDPALMAEAVEGIADFLSAVDGFDRDALAADAERVHDELQVLHADVESLLASIPEERRVLVTGHDVLGAFAERYGFEVVGTVIPSGSTADGGSAGGLVRLAEDVRAAGVPAVFVDASASDRLARTLASEAGDIQVVPLFTESLGPEGSGADTYPGMVRTNAERIAAALGADAT